MLIHYDNNSVKASLFIKIYEIIMHCCIVSRLSFSSNVKSKILVLITDSSHHRNSSSSWRWDCHSNIVIFRLPNATSCLPHVSWCLVEIHYFSAFSIMLSTLVNKMNSLKEYFLRSMPACQSFPHSSVRYPVLNIELSQSRDADLNSVEILYQLAPP